MFKRKHFEKVALKLLPMFVVLSMLIGPMTACQKKDNNTSGADKTGSSATAAKTTAGKSGSSSADKSGTTAAAKTGTVSDAGGSGNSGGGGQAAAGGSGDGNGDSGSGSGDAGAEAPGDTWVAPEVKIDFGGKTLVFAAPHGTNGTYWDNETNNAITAILLKRWQEAEKKFNFKIEPLSVDLYTHPAEVAKSVMAGITPCDFFISQPRFFFPVYVNQKIILPVDDYINPADYKFLDDNPFAYNTGAWRGRLYGINNAVGSIGTTVVYNRDVLAREGLPDILDLAENMQWNWDTFLEYAKNTTKDNNGDGIFDQWGIIPHTVEYMASTIIWSNGGRYLADNNGRIDFGLDDPKSIKALQFFSDLYNVYKVVGTGAFQNFSNGNYTMAVGLTAMYTVFKDAGMKNLGVAPAPLGPDVSDYQSVVFTSSYDVFFPVNIKDPANTIKMVADVHYSSEYENKLPESSDLLRTTYKMYTLAGGTDRDMNMLLKLAAAGEIDGYQGFTGLQAAVNSKVYTPVSKGSTSVGSLMGSAVSEIQALIDGLMGQ